MKRWLASFLCILGLLIAVAVGYGWGHRTSTISTAAAGQTPAPAASRPVVYWYDPMVPEQHFDKPGLSPMGMEMVPKYADVNDTAGSVRIDPATLQNLGVRIASVQHRVLDAEIQAPGTVTWDLRQAITVSARADGVITRLHVRAPYTSVATGEPLADLLAPSWNSALAESAALRQVQSPDARALQDAADQRLRVLGMTSSDLSGARTQDGGVTLRAPKAGVITSLDVREGQRVTAGQTLMTLNGLTSVWIEAAIPQALAGRVSSGTAVSVSSDALPGQRLTGTVETLLPDLDPTTRTQRARILLAHPDSHIVPGQFVRVAFTPASNAAALTVPTEALIITGDHPRVMVALGDGRFRPTTVQTGRTASGYTEIVAGLRDGDQVVASGQFLIDSEASLSGALERLDHDDVAPAAARSAPVGGER